MLLERINVQKERHFARVVIADKRKIIGDISQTIQRRDWRFAMIGRKTQGGCDHHHNHSYGGELLYSLHALLLSSLRVGLSRVLANA